MFFFISGFLFFYKSGTFNRNIYGKKVKSRIKSLLVPYIIWNFIGFLVLSVKCLPLLSGIFPGVADVQYNFTTFLDCFWAFVYPNADSSVLQPINYPFWFVRDLMIVVLCTPLLYWFIKYTKVIVVFLMGYCWFFNIIPATWIPSSEALFFFSAGAYLSISGKNVLTVFRNFHYIIPLYVLMIILDTFTKDYFVNNYIHHLGILLGIISVFLIVSHYLYKGKIIIDGLLLNGSFFVFAMHALFIGEFGKVVIQFGHIQSPYLLIVVYAFIPVLTILICLGTYRILRSVLPRLTTLLVGGR